MAYWPWYSISVVVALFGLLGLIEAGEFCFTHNFENEWCDYGCCNDGFIQECCASSPLVIIIIGSVIGGIAFVVLMVVLIVICQKKKKTPGRVIQAPADAGQIPMTHMTGPNNYNNILNVGNDRYLQQIPVINPTFLPPPPPKY